MNKVFSPLQQHQFLKISALKMIMATVKIYLLQLCTLYSAPSGILKVRENPGSFQSTALLEARSRTSWARLLERRKESSQAWVFINHSTWTKGGKTEEIWRQLWVLWNWLVKKNSGEFFGEKKWSTQKGIISIFFFKFIERQHKNPFNS